MLTAITSDPLVWVTHYVLALLGAVTVYVLSERTVLEGAGAILILRRLFPDRTERFYTFWDLLLTSLLGSIIGLIVYSPQTSLQCLAAGIGWAGAYKSLSAISKTNSEIGPPRKKKVGA